MKLVLDHRRAFWIILAGWVGSSGCTHNHYYTGVPACVPSGLPVSSQVGQVCEVPDGQAVSGSTVLTPGTSSSVVVQGSRQGTAVVMNGQPRVVISQPAPSRSIGQSSGRFKWRAPDPETLTTTRTEGYLENETTRR